MLVAALLLTGCSSAPREPSGFLASYDQLEPVPGGHERVAVELAEIDAFIIDPVEFHDADRWGLDDEQRVEAGRLMRERCEAVLAAAGYRVTDVPGPNVGRVRMVLTDVRGSVFLLSLHPGAKLTGAGAGSASMEGEVVHAVTGEQLLAIVRTGRGNQFELDTFDKFDDLTDVIEAWADELAERLSVEVPRS
ncbi:MAG: DUF3313 domain-containing protein [Phycisphaerales bacterium]